MSATKLIVGLGNPGPQYAKNRHNIGFQVVELFARQHGLAIDKLQMKAITGTGWVARSSQQVKVLLARPLTYMNASGEAVAPLVRFYHLDPADVMVVHDDLDMAAGKLRLRAEGSSGGQNGVKSIIERLGTQAFPRLKLGIGRPPGRMDPADYVLQNFAAAEEAVFGPLRERAVEALDCWLFEDIETAMNRFNR